MLASETEEISNFLKQFVIKKRVKKIIKIFLLILGIRFVMQLMKNQKATYGLLEVNADIGYCCRWLQ